MLHVYAYLFNSIKCNSKVHKLKLQRCRNCFIYNEVNKTERCIF